MTYPTIDSIVRAYDPDTGASEAHGMATGMLCMDDRAGCENWLTELFNMEQTPSVDEIGLLSGLFEQTRKLLLSESFEFDILLPEEDQSIGEQAEGIRAWCSGFLLGVGYAGGQSEWPGDTGEILQDFSEFAKLDTDVDGEEDANDLAQINEYIRAAVILIHDEMNTVSREGTIN